MKKTKTVMMTAIIMLAVIFCVPQQVRAAQAMTEEEKWDAWVQEQSEAEKCVIRLRIDDVPMAGYGLYYETGNQEAAFYWNKTLEENMASGAIQKLEESSVYPGCFLIDKEYKDADTGYIARGHFYLYNPGETSARNQIQSMWYSDVCPGGDDLATLDYYTVSFGQGDVEVMELPDSFIHKAGKFDDAYNIKIADDYPSYLHAGSVEAGGYMLSYFADENGKKAGSSDAYYELKSPVTLHPVFVNEQEANYNEQKHLGNYIYYDYTYDADKSNNEAVPVVVTTPEEFILAVTSSERKSRFIIVRGDIKITAKSCHEICEANGIRNTYDEEYGYTRLGGIDTYTGNLVIIEKDANLTLDGVHISCAVNWESSALRITVQDEGSLELSNNAQLEYAALAVQKNAIVKVDDASGLDCNYLYNYGTIEFADRENYDRVNDNRWLTKLSVGQTFFNAASGKITGYFGKFEFDLGENMWRLPSDWAEGNFGNMRCVPFRNNGTMTFKDNCKVFVGEDSGSVYQHDRCAQMPFINNGTISVSSISSDNTIYYHSNVMEIGNGSFVNNGTLNILNRYGKYPCTDTSYYSSSAEGRGLSVNQAELVNAGTINIDNEKGMGALFNGIYFNPEDCSNTNKSVDTIQRSRLNNLENGVVNVTTSDETVGIAFSDNTECNNKGTINLNFKEGTGKTHNMSLLMENSYYEDRISAFHNDGKVINNGYIAYGKVESRVWEGNAWTGSGSDGAILFIAKEEPEPSEDVKIGSIITDKTSKAKYVVTLINDKKHEVSYKCPTVKNAKAITVPKTIKVNYVTYKVTSVAAGAFKNQSKLTSIVIESNVNAIGKQAFSGCKKLSTITIKNTKMTAKTISANAFKGVGTKTVIKVPKSKKSAYTKLFRNKGLAKKVKIK